MMISLKFKKKFTSYIGVPIECIIVYYIPEQNKNKWKNHRKRI